MSVGQVHDKDNLADFYIIVSFARARAHETRTRTRAISTFNNFNIVFNISTLLNFITTEYFNISTDYQQNIQQKNITKNNMITQKKYNIQHFNKHYYYVYNKLK